MVWWFKLLWWIAVALNLASNILLIVGATANFQRSMDLESRFILMFFGIPALILLVMSVVGLTTQSSNNALVAKYVAGTIIIILLLSLIPNNLKVTQSQAAGWLYDYVSSDPIKLTDDGKYQYRLDLINESQRNKKQLLYIKSISSGEEKYIQLPMQMDPSTTQSTGVGDWAWARMKTAKEEDQYELTTTERLGVPIQTFRVNIRQEKAYRIAVE